MCVGCFFALRVVCEHIPYGSTVPSTCFLAECATSAITRHGRCSALSGWSPIFELSLYGGARRQSDSHFNSSASNDRGVGCKESLLATASAAIASSAEAYLNISARSHCSAGKKSTWTIRSQIHCRSAPAFFDSTLFPPVYGCGRERVHLCLRVLYFSFRLKLSQ